MPCRANTVDWGIKRDVTQKLSVHMHSMSRCSKLVRK